MLAKFWQNNYLCGRQSGWAQILSTIIMLGTCGFCSFKQDVQRYRKVFGNEPIINIKTL